MSESLVVCEVDEQLVEKLKKFRFRKETNNAAIINFHLNIEYSEETIGHNLLQEDKASMEDLLLEMANSLIYFN